MRRYFIKQQDVELTTEDLKELAAQFKAEYKEKIGEDFPDDPKEQLMGAIKAVFRSWDNPRANVYRRDNDIPYSWGTAVNVQSMAFGNMGDDCGTGVAFTRDPATGEKGLFGEFLTNAQGEDVVAGVRTPMKIVLSDVWRSQQELFTGSRACTCTVGNMPWDCVWIHHCGCDFKKHYAGAGKRISYGERIYGY